MKQFRTHDINLLQIYRNIYYTFIFLINFIYNKIYHSVYLINNKNYPHIFQDLIKNSSR